MGDAVILLGCRHCHALTAARAHLRNPVAPHHEGKFTKCVAFAQWFAGPHVNGPAQLHRAKFFNGNKFRESVSVRTSLWVMAARHDLGIR